MRAVEEVREKAELFGWERKAVATDEDTFVRADRAILVLYRNDGAVHEAYRYYLGWKLDTAHGREPVREKYKKENVIAWLAEAV